MVYYNIFFVLILTSLSDCISIALVEFKPVLEKKDGPIRKEHHGYRKANDQMPFLMKDFLPATSEKLGRIERIPRDIKASSVTNLKAVAGIINCNICSCPATKSYNPEKCKICCSVDEQNSSIEERKPELDSSSPVSSVNCNTCNCSIETSVNREKCKSCCHYEPDSQANKTKLDVRASSDINSWNQSVNCDVCHCPAERSYNPEKCKICCPEEQFDTKVDKLEPVINGNSEAMLSVNDCNFCRCPIEKSFNNEKCNLCCPNKKFDFKVDKIEPTINGNSQTEPVLDCTACNCSLEEIYNSDNCNLCCQLHNTKVDMINYNIKPKSVAHAKASSGASLLIPISIIIIHR